VLAFSRPIYRLESWEVFGGPGLGYEWSIVIVWAGLVCGHSLFKSSEPAPDIFLFCFANKSSSEPTRHMTHLDEQVFLRSTLRIPVRAALSTPHMAHPLTHSRTIPPPSFDFSFFQSPSNRNSFNHTVR
jgi:hypothetical protein